MTTKKDKLSLFLFIDAFGWELKQRHPDFLNSRIVESKPLETILGYSSACDPSIISGLTPAEHKLWSSFYYDPKNSPFKWTRPLRLLPNAIFQRGRIRNLMSRWVKKRCGFSGYFQLYAVPFEHLHLFNYAEQKRIWEPGGLPCGLSIFDRMQQAGRTYYAHNSADSDRDRIEKLRHEIEQQSIEFAYCSLGNLDGLMHAKGNDHPDIATLLNGYDEKICNLLDTAEANYNEVSWYLFTDHGMHNVNAAYNLMADLEALGLEWNKDYIAFYDSTMARIWLLHERARDPIYQCLTHHPRGRILSEQELKDFGVWFEDHQYGDLVFLMNSGTQIVPSFMGAKACQGMHGYHPSDPDSRASISSGKPIPESITKIQHIYNLMLSELGIE
jgi:predicted AlkP superfamily pyrophosphatase or phosphodiesterase